MDLASGGGGNDQRVGLGQCHDALDCHGGVVDTPMERGGRDVVFLAYFGAVADIGNEFLLWLEVVGQFGLQLPDLVE